MEHLEHLNETWEMLRELLTEKGMLIVAVPNCSSYDAGRYGEYWAAYDVPRHLWHFTPVTIQQLASRHGFIMAARHPMPFDAFYVSMLSEKHRGSSCSFLKGMYAGTLAWFSTLGRRRTEQFDDLRIPEKKIATWEIKTDISRSHCSICNS